MWPLSPYAEARAKSTISAYLEGSRPHPHSIRIPLSTVDSEIDRDLQTTYVIRGVLESRASVCLSGNHWSVVDPVLLSVRDAFSSATSVVAISCAGDALSARKWGVPTIACALGIRGWDMTPEAAVKQFAADAAEDQGIAAQYRKLQQLHVLIVHSLHLLAPAQLEYVDCYLARLLSNHAETHGGLRKVQFIASVDLQAPPPPPRHVGADTPRRAFKVDDKWVTLLERPTATRSDALHLDPPTWLAPSFVRSFELVAEFATRSALRSSPADLADLAQLQGSPSSLTPQRPASLLRDPAAPLTVFRDLQEHLRSRGRDNLPPEVFELWKSLCSSSPAGSTKRLGSYLQVHNRWRSTLNEGYAHNLYSTAECNPAPRLPPDDIPSSASTSRSATYTARVVVALPDHVTLNDEWDSDSPEEDLLTRSRHVAAPELELTVGTRVMFTQSTSPSKLDRPEPQSYPWPNSTVDGPFPAIARRQFGTVVGFANVAAFRAAATDGLVAKDHPIFAQDVVVDGLDGARWGDAYVQGGRDGAFLARRVLPAVASPALNRNPELRQRCDEAAWYGVDSDALWPLVLLDPFGPPGESLEYEVVLIGPQFHTITVGDVFSPLAITRLLQADADPEQESAAARRRLERLQTLLMELEADPVEARDLHTVVCVVAQLPFTPSCQVPFTVLHGHYIPDRNVHMELADIRSCQPMWLAAAAAAVRLPSQLSFSNGGVAPRLHWDSEYGNLIEKGLDFLDVEGPDADWTLPSGDSDDELAATECSSGSDGARSPAYKHAGPFSTSTSPRLPHVPAPAHRPARNGRPGKPLPLPSPSPPKPILKNDATVPKLPQSVRIAPSRVTLSPGGLASHRLDNIDLGSDDWTLPASSGATDPGLPPASRSRTPSKRRRPLTVPADLFDDLEPFSDYEPSPVKPLLPTKRRSPSAADSRTFARDAPVAPVARDARQERGPITMASKTFATQSDSLSSSPNLSSGNSQASQASPRERHLGLQGAWPAKHPTPEPAVLTAARFAPAPAVSPSADVVLHTGYFVELGVDPSVTLSRPGVAERLGRDAAGTKRSLNALAKSAGYLLAVVTGDAKTVSDAKASCLFTEYRVAAYDAVAGGGCLFSGAQHLRVLVPLHGHAPRSDVAGRYIALPLAGAVCGVDRSGLPMRPAAVTMTLASACEGVVIWTPPRAVPGDDRYVISVLHEFPHSHA
ncbi:hypothetical protein Rhopal_006056-T1, partial [Rhodotorula paludigena]